MAIQHTDKAVSSTDVTVRVEWIESFLNAPDRAAKTAVRDEAMRYLGVSKSRFYALVNDYVGAKQKAIRDDPLGDPVRKGAAALRRRTRSDAGKQRSLGKADRDLWLGFALERNRQHLSVDERCRLFRDWLYTHTQRTLDCSDMTLRRALDGVDVGHQRTKRENREGFMRHLKMGAPYTHFLWQADQRTADVQCRRDVVDPATGEITTKVARPILFHFVDYYSGMELGGRYAWSYDTDLVEAALLDAIYPDVANNLPVYGLPEHIYWDNGEQHKSRWIGAVARSLGIELHYSEALRPITHGFVEQTHHWVKDTFEAKLPGFVGGDNKADNRPLHRRREDQGEVKPEELLTLEELNLAYKAWVHDVVMVRPYRGKTGPSRYERWRKGLPEGKGLDRVPEPDELAWEFMHEAQAKVTGGCFQFRTVTYTGPHLGSFNGEFVQFRYREDDVMRVFVEHRGKLFCVATPREQHLYFTVSGFRDLERRNRELRDTRRGLEESARTMRAAVSLALVPDAEVALQAADSLDQAAKALPKKVAATLKDRARALSAQNEDKPYRSLAPDAERERLAEVKYLVPKPETRPIGAAAKPKPDHRAIDSFLGLVDDPPAPRKAKGADELL